MVYVYGTHPLPPLFHFPPYGVGGVYDFYSPYIYMSTYGTSQLYIYIFFIDIDKYYTFCIYRYIIIGCQSVDKLPGSIYYMPIPCKEMSLNMA